MIYKKFEMIAPQRHSPLLTAPRYGPSVKCMDMECFNAVFNAPERPSPLLNHRSLESLGPTRML
jgi:hypothetical protein